MTRRRFVTVSIGLLLFTFLAGAVSAGDIDTLWFGEPSGSAYAEQSGVVRSGSTPIALSTVSLYKAGRSLWGAVLLGKTLSDEAGNFTISYRRPADSGAVLYLIADGKPTLLLGPRFGLLGSPVRLAAILNPGSDGADVVINERTTVAAAYSMAQFIFERRIGGKFPGLQNAAKMAQNIADNSTGEVGAVLAESPNGSETTAMREFNSLANLLAACVSGEDPDSCAQLFSLARPPVGPKPANTLQAMVNIAHYPWQNVPELFDLSQTSDLYQPALESTMVPDAWTLAVRFESKNGTLDGPGAIAFDRDGNAWVINNYNFNADATLVCGDNHLYKITPVGEAPDSPYGGFEGNGGLYGAGFGVTVDPYGDVWVGNFGFQGSDCFRSAEEQDLLASSVSQFDSDGIALSPSRPPEPYGGWRSDQANIFRPQATVSDQWGNIWIANCGNDSVTKLPGGSLDNALNFDNVGLDKPFGLAIDAWGNAWVASNGNNAVIELSPDGSVIGEPITGGDINLPMGIAVDKAGNVWIANSGAVRPPCHDGESDADRLSPTDADAELPPAGASVTLRRSNGKLETFTGGGIFIPWGVAVDGNGNVWVANFGGPRSGLVGVTELCGAEPWNCPRGFRTGDPISPDTGYTSDGLTRLTGVAIDPSGNVWLANNWLRDAFQNLDNPGGYQVVVLVGLAGPVKAPLLGPPRRPW